MFVDGRLLDGSTEFVELRSDEPHKLYFKRAGEPPHLIVLEAGSDDEGRPRLQPADPCRELRRGGSRSRADDRGGRRRGRRRAATGTGTLRQRASTRVRALARRDACCCSSRSFADPALADEALRLRYGWAADQTWLRHA